MANILAIHAHPDDVEILAGGTMWALVQLFGAAASVPLSSP